jgi:hypothetical protein
MSPLGNNEWAEALVQISPRGLQSTLKILRTAVDEPG